MIVTLSSREQFPDCRNNFELDIFMQDSFIVVSKLTDHCMKMTINVYNFRIGPCKYYVCYDVSSLRIYIIIPPSFPVDVVNADNTKRWTAASNRALNMSSAITNLAIKQGAKCKFSPLYFYGWGLAQQCSRRLMAADNDDEILCSLSKVQFPESKYLLKVL